jgi:thiamine-phosphate pyrophosphorylase
MTLVPDNFGLYLVLTEPIAGYEACTEAAVAEGIRFVQLRMKHAPMDRVLEIARRLRDLTKGSPTRFIVNDSVAIAKEVDADGVHLGQTDIPTPQARREWDMPGKIFGWSTHNEQQAAEAVAQRADYIGFGPVFPTPTKNPPDPVVGCNRLAQIVKVSPLPVVAIGGIDATNLPQVLAAGTRNFAVVRAVCGQSSPREAIRKLMDIWKRYRGPA